MVLELARTSRPGDKLAELFHRKPPSPSPSPAQPVATLGFIPGLAAHIADVPVLLHIGPTAAPLAREISKSLSLDFGGDPAMLAYAITVARWVGALDRSVPVPRSAWANSRAASTLVWEARNADLQWISDHNLMDFRPWGLQLVSSRPDDGRALLFLGLLCEMEGNHTDANFLYGLGLDHIHRQDMTGAAPTLWRALARALDSPGHNLESEWWSWVETAGGGNSWRGLNSALWRSNPSLLRRMLNEALVRFGKWESTYVVVGQILALRAADERVGRDIWRRGYLQHPNCRMLKELLGGDGIFAYREAERILKDFESRPDSEVPTR